MVLIMMVTSEVMVLIMMTVMSEVMVFTIDHDGYESEVMVLIMMMIMRARLWY